MHEARREFFLVSLAAAVLLAGASPLLAQGFGIYEQGGCQMGRAGAGVANPCDDGSGTFFNPAGVATDRGFTLTAGLTGIGALGDFTTDRGSTTDLANELIPLPHAFLRYGFGDALAVSFGTYVPYGLATEWPETFPGRFTAFESELRSIYLQPTLTYALDDRISIGGGPTIVLSAVKLLRREDLAEVPIPAGLGAPPGASLGDFGIPGSTDFAQTELESDYSTGYGFNVGALFELTERVQAGIRYLSEVEIDYEQGEALFEPVPTGLVLPPGNPFGAPGGTPLDLVLASLGVFEPGGLLGDQGVTTRITMPDQLVLGVSVGATDRLTLVADYQWTNWTDFDEVPLDFENPATPDQLLIQSFENTSGIRIGAEYAFPEWKLRAGYIFNQEAAPPETVTPLLPEASRNHFTLGTTIRLADWAAFHGAYQYLGQEDRRGRVKSPPPGEAPTVDLNSGVYGFSAHLFGTTLTLSF